jgi:type VI secretion system secreted protein Hcp
MDKKLQLTAITICTVALALVGYTIDANAAAYVKFDGIDGEATDAKHKEWIEVLSFSQSIHRGDSGSSARTTASAVFEDIVLTKELDKSSPKLAESIAMGKVIPKVEFELTSSAGTYYKYELTNVMVTSYSVSGDADERPTEQVSLNFEQIKTTYTEYGSDGSKKGNAETTWKVEKGEK